MMKQLIDRFHYASQSPFGTLLLILFAILVVLGVSYTVLFLLRRKQDQLTAKNLFYFNHAEELIKEWIFEGEHRADFFGRETRACTKDGIYGRCLILPQELSTSETVGRFRQFASTKEGARLAVFAPYLYKHDEHPLLFIQGKVAKPAGQLASLQSFMKDSAVSDAEKETLLMELAKALEQLHRLKDKDGISLYHGFILPRSCYIEKTDNGHSLVVADLGLAYTLGPDRMYQRLQLLKNAKLPIEKYTGNALVQQVALLAPEQKDPERFACVGSPADYYSFAALSVLFFTGSFDNEIDWKKVPERWHQFLQQCLQDDTSQRPVSFHDLEEWLENPELHLTHHDGEEMLLSIPEPAEEKPAAEIPATIEPPKTAPIIEDPEFIKCFTAGSKALKTSKWETAADRFSAALKLNPDHLEAHVKLAIAYYELGSIDDAEKHYHFVKERDAVTAKLFRKHIAFRI